METLSERILGGAAGTYVDRRVDRCYVHDGTGVLTLEAWREMGCRIGMSPARIGIIFDHIVPANNSLTATLQGELRGFAREKEIYFSDVGGGICHQVMAEQQVMPGEVVVGADSHTCTLGAYGAFATGVGATDMAAVWTTGCTWFRVPETIGLWLEGALTGMAEAKDLALTYVSLLGMEGAHFQAIEFVGEETGVLSMDDRMTLANLAVETGAKAGLFYPDEVTRRDIAGRLQGVAHPLPAITRSPDCAYARELTIDCSDVVPVVAVPPRVDTIKPVSELEGVHVDQVFVGTCTNGRYADLRAFSRFVKGRRVKIRTVVVPASRQVLSAALASGVVQVLIEAGCTVGIPGCGPCLGAHMGVIGEGEVCLSTANRNFRNRMGVGGEIYLSSVATAAASALAGEITVPEAADAG